MSVQRYRRKPDPVSREDQFAAKYEPGQPLTDLEMVARMADSHAELAEVAFPSGQVLIVRYARYDDDHPPKTAFEAIKPGHYLAYSRANYFLYDTDDGDLRQFYDLVEDRKL